MMILDVLHPEEVKTLRTVLAGVPWLDGKTTAGARAKRVKNNLQADPGNLATQQAGLAVEAALKRCGAFMQNVYPAKITRPLFSRYRDGMTYGEHVDNALSPEGVRVDVAVTVFLADPEEYDGGELLAEGMGPVKLGPGQAVVYPATTLHSVAPVTRGERLAAVVWVQSRVRCPRQRQLLADLGMVYAHLQNEHPDGPATDLALQTYANLARMWLE
jgi:PKHD-type hydroxylase